MEPRPVLPIPQFQTFSPWTGEKIHFFCFKPPSLWSLVMAAPENKYGPQVLITSA